MSRSLLGCVAIGCTLLAGQAWAGPNAGSALGLLAASSAGQTAAAPDASEESRRQVLDLLARARQAADEGRWETAESLVSRAEAMNVSFGLFHLGDTPQKVRRDLDRARGAQVAQGPSTPTAPPASAGPVAPGGAAMPTPSESPFGKPPTTTPPAADTLGAGLSGRGLMPEDARAQSASLLVAARKALAVGDARRAKELVEQARALKLNYGFNDDSPSRVESLVNRVEELMRRPAAEKDSDTYRRQYVELHLAQADGLIAYREFDEAERLCRDAERMGVTFGPFETTPGAVLARVTQARGAAGSAAAPPAAPMTPPLTGGPPAATPTPSGLEMLPPVAGAQPIPAPAAAAADPRSQCLDLVRQARTALVAGDLDRAERLAHEAESLAVPDSAFGPQDDRYWLVLLDVQKRRRSPVELAGGTVPAGPAAPQGAMQAGYDPAQDPTRTLPAASQSALPPGPAAGMMAAPPPGEALRLLAAGEEALRNQQPGVALALFKQAQAREDELDPAARQRLQDRLTLVAQPPTAPPGGAPRSLLEEAAQTQQLLARQVSADLARLEAQAQQLRETNPNGARDLLQQARTMVERAGLEPGARDVLLRRVDRALADLQNFQADNAPRLALEERNRDTEARVAREQQIKVEVQEKLALLVDEFNTLMDEQRFAEAQVVARRAAELAPEEPVVLQLQAQAKFVMRMHNNGRIMAESEDGVVGAIASVEKSGAPFDDSEPYRMPNATDWERLTTIRRSLRRDSGRLTPKELEIQQKLKTPVSLSFNQEPLSSALDTLERLTQVNLHLDPRGLAEEGIDPSTPVTIKLSQEIQLKSALNLILEPLHLGYVIRDEVLLITSEQLKDGVVYPVTYNVADLVMPIPNFVPSNQMGLAGALTDAHRQISGGAVGFGGPPLGVLGAAQPAGGPALDPKVLGQFQGGGVPIPVGGGGPPSAGQPQNIGFGPGGMGGGVQPDFDSLINLITKTVAPTTWVDVGGQGSIEEFPSNLSLVISQTQEVHEEIARLLQQLRELQDLQVTIEVRFISLADNFFERIGLDFDFDIDDDIDGPLQVFGRQNDNAAAFINRTQFQNPPFNVSSGTGVGTNPPRDVQDRDHGPSATVGLAAPGVFSADLDIPFNQNSITIAAPPGTFGYNGIGASGGANLGFAILSDLEAYFFLEAVQNDVRTNLLQAPKVTLFNGQQAFVSDTVQSPFVISVTPVVGDFAAAQQPVIVVLNEGTSLSVQAVVSPDRRFVRLTVVPFFSQIQDVDTFTFEGSETTVTRSQSDGPENATTGREEESETVRSGTTVQLPQFAFTTVTTTVSVPDGGTVLLGGIKRMSEDRRENGVPLLSKLPYINRFFSNVSTGKQTSSLMMMVTPRIIIQEEEEALLGVPPSP